jgi:cytochrome c oxidase assembly protein subunit 15
MRHTEAGLAIPDFPLSFGHLLPPHWDVGITVHFAHRVGALIVTLLIVSTTGHVLYHYKNNSELRRPALLLLLLLGIQVTLGAYVIWTSKQFIINSAHVASGAMVLGTSLVLTLRAHRDKFSIEERSKTYKNQSSAGVLA